MEIHQLGAIDMAYDPGSGVVSESANSAYTPGGDIATNLNQVKSGPKNRSGRPQSVFFNQIKSGPKNLLGRPQSVLKNVTTQAPAGPAVGGGATPELKEEKPPVGGEGGSTPPEVREQWEKENKKRKQRNMIALGIGGLVLAYLLFRKK